MIGTEKRGVELPHVSQNFETNVPGIYIAGEMGGMGLIKNAVEQGKQAVENITKSIKKSDSGDYDLVIVGAGPAGISASLMAKKNNLKFATLEQDSLGGTVFSFPRSKIVMTSAMELPLYGKLKLFETSKSELLEIWERVLKLNNIKINETEKVEYIKKEKDSIEIKSNKQVYSAKKVLLAIGRRGSPRKLGVNGEGLEKVAYRLLEPELIHNQNILVVGGGDSAIEGALLLVDENNKVSLSYRKNNFSRLKPKNHQKIEKYSEDGLLDVYFNSNLIEVLEKEAILGFNDRNAEKKIENDLVYIFAGGELPTQFLRNSGIEITKKFGETVLGRK